MDKEFTTVSIPTSLYKKIEKAIEGSEFRSVSSYIVKTLKDGLSKGDEPTAGVFSKDEEDKVKERLKSLGYID